MEQGRSAASVERRRGLGGSARIALVVALTLLGLGAAAPVASADGPIDLLTAANVRIDGPLPSDLAGVSVAAAGDPNNDGIDDVIVGASNADINGSSSGSAYVVYGQATPATVNLASLGNGGFRIDGPLADDLAGTSVAAAGDPNGDGIDDVIVGAGGADNNGRSNSGSAYVVYGQSAADPADLNLGTLTTTNTGRGLRIDGQAVDDGAGGNVSSVAAAGDINGDGTDDVIVGARRADNNSRLDSGSAYIVYGQSTADPADLM